MNNETSGFPRNDSDEVAVNAEGTDNVDNDTRDIVHEGNTTIITQDENNLQLITFDDQTAIVAKRKKDNEKRNTVICFVPKENEFKNYLDTIYSTTEEETWQLITPDKVKKHVFKLYNHVFFIKN